jgi:hypothetical protein
MKRILLPVLLLAAGLASIQAQGTTLSIQNQENAWFYFVVDPPEMKGLVPTSPSLPGRIAQYFSRENAGFPFSSLQPFSGLKVEGLPEGTHLLVGFFVIEDRDEFPVKVLGLQVDGKMGERFYPLYSDPALLSVSRDKGSLARFARETKKQQQIPQQGTAEKTSAPQASARETPAAVAETPAVAPSDSGDKGRAVQPLAAFTTAFRPAIFTRESGDEFQVLGISESRFWGGPGTGLREVRAVLQNGVLRFTVSAQAAFSRNVSYFLYAFDQRGSRSASPLTVEVKPLGPTGPGVAVLWERGAASPALFGDAVAVADSITVLLDLSVVPERIWKALGNAPSFDLTSCWFDPEAGTYEEFYLTSFSAADIPAL